MLICCQINLCNHFQPLVIFFGFQMEVYTYDGLGLLNQRSCDDPY